MSEAADSRRSSTARSRSAAVERRRRLFACAGGVGQLVLGALALRHERRDLRVELAATGCSDRRVSASARRSASRREIECRDRCLKPRDLRKQLLRPLGGRRLQGKWAQPLLHLVLQIARALDLDAHAGELQLRAMATTLETPETGGFLDQLPPLGRLGVQHRLDTALRDDGAQTAAEPDVGEQLDEVEPANRRLVDEVLPFAAAVEAALDQTSLNGSSGQAPSALSKRRSTSQKSSWGRPAEPAKSTSSGFSARNSPGLIEPVAQRIESDTLDFPEPFGPTTTETPGSSRISTGSTNDLNPRSLIDFRCTRAGG